MRGADPSRSRILHSSGREGSGRHPTPRASLVALRKPPPRSRPKPLREVARVAAEQVGRVSALDLSKIGARLVWRAAATYPKTGKEYASCRKDEVLLQRGALSFFVTSATLTD